MTDGRMIYIDLYVSKGLDGLDVLQSYIQNCLRWPVVLVNLSVQLISLVAKPKGLDQGILLFIYKIF